MEASVGLSLWSLHVDRSRQTEVKAKILQGLAKRRKTHMFRRTQVMVEQNPVGTETDQAGNLG